MIMFTRDKAAEAPATPSVKEVELPARPAEQASHAPIQARPVDHGTPPAKTRPASEASRISSALKVIGQLESEEDIQIDGHIEGDVRARKVMIGAGATVKGTVFGEDVEVSGTVTGKIEAASVVLSKSARMTGDVIHKALQIEKGAYIDGHCRPQGSSDAASSVAITKRGDKQSMQ
jgi:cytoskeletal protein CcmA (bactofilin family)